MKQREDFGRMGARLERCDGTGNTPTRQHSFRKVLQCGTLLPLRLFLTERVAGIAVKSAFM